MQAQCPICDAAVNPGENVEVSEIVSCSECKNKLEVTGKNAQSIMLKEAPKIEEDWGE